MHLVTLAALLSLVVYNTHAKEIFDATVERTFVIGKNDFLMDGKPFRYISGTLHYFRVVPTSWRDRLRKMKYAGLNAVQTYTIWSSHEPEPGTYDFKDRLNVVKFIKMAQEEGLYVILRPGPFIDAEVDMGGLPYWLLRENPNMKLRTSDESYIKYVDKWMTILLQKVKPLIYQNGGPIIMVQIENEYGSYGSCDFKYTAHLRDLTKSILGDEVVLFTTDGNSDKYLKCGKIAGVYATVDFGTGASINKSFEAQRLFEPEGPLVNSEFYTGWLDHYGSPHSTVNCLILAFKLDEILGIGASVNFYVFNGGTSFGTLAGSNIINGKFLACPTSYDYDAPMNEAGDLTEKYFAIRNVIGRYVNLPSGPVPSDSKKSAHGKVSVRAIAGMPHLLKIVPDVTSKEPKTFEELSVPNGVVAYQTVIQHLTADPSLLIIDGLRDRGYVFIDADFVGMISRNHNISSLGIHAKRKQLLTIIVESMGRVCFGEQINDWKGLKGATLSGRKLVDWNMLLLPFEGESLNKFLDKAKLESTSIAAGSMVFFEGEFTISYVPKDTFLKQDIWSKGYVWINDFLLGRYWPAVGPQMTLYVPGELLRRGRNTIKIFELEEADCNHDCYVEFVHAPTINGRTPFYS